MTMLLKLKHKTAWQWQEPDSAKVVMEGIKVWGVRTTHFLRDVALETKTQDGKMLKESVQRSRLKSRECENWQRRARHFFKRNVGASIPFKDVRKSG